MALPAERLFAAEAIEFLAAAVPLPDAVVELPNEDRVVRDLDEVLCLAQLPLAFAQRILDPQPLGDVDEGDDDAVDPVVDRPVRPQPDVEPAAVAAADLALDRGE